MFSNLFLRQIRLSSPVEEGSYLSAIPAIAKLDRLDLESPVTFLAGENGSGKSTLLEGIAVAFGFNPEGGGWNFQFSTQDTHSSLSRHLTLVRGLHRPRDGFFLRAESFYNLASEVDRLEEISPGGEFLKGYGGKSLHRQSHGESFLALLEHRFRGNGLYLMDEPEASLSPSRLLEVLCRIRWLVEQGSQLIIATHSPILMAYPGARLFWLDGEGIRPASYRDTPHCQITHSFLENPQRMLHYLWGED